MKYPIISILLLLAGCEANQKPVATTAAPAPPKPLFEAPADYSQLRENLPGSPYYYQIHISGIKFQTVKKAFEQRQDAYSLPTFSPGKRLSFTFEMTNPYDKPMLAPVPAYFWLQSANFDLGQGAGAPNTTYNRSSHVYELNGGSVTTATGGELYHVPGAERGSGSDYSLPFKAHQARRFRVTFDKPFPLTCNPVTLLGFTRSNQNAGEQIYTGLVLDVPTGKIIDQLFHKRNDPFVPAN